MKSSSRSVSAVDSETSKHSKHPVALRLFYSVIVAVVAAALLPVIPVAAKPNVPAVSSAAASAYIPVTPVRLLDTRTTGGPLAANTTRDLAVTGTSPLAPTGATAVMLNVTVTNTTAASFLTVYGTSSSRPLASNLNWKPGQTIPNLVETPVGAGGSVTFYNAAGSTDVVADLEGYYFAPGGSGGGEVALTPARITDTRAGSGEANAGSTLAAGASLAIQATGAGGVPSTGVSGVILNVTVTNTTAASFLTVWPTGATQNVVSNLNWVPGQTIANRVFVPVGTGGKVSVFNAAGSTDVVVDVSGYFTANGQLFTPQIPLRIEDTRSDGKTLVTNTSFSIQVAGVAGVPLTATAVILNVTATDTTASSFLTVYPSTATRPLASDLNWTAGVTIPNLTVATLGSTGMVSFYNAAGSTDVVVDLFGFFGGGAGVTVTANPTSLAANPTLTGPTSKVDVTVNDANGNPIALDPVSFTLTPSVAGSCGTGLSSQTTNGAGKIPQQTYKPTAVVGTCLITATEAIGAKTGSVTITQTAPPNAIAFAPNNAGGISIPVAANGAVQSFTTTTTNSATSAPILGDTLTFTTSGGASCGTIGNILPAGGVSPANGQVTFDYTSSNIVGFCTITARESMTSATNSVLVSQRVPTGTNVSALTATTTTTILANGTDTVALMDTVTGSAGISSDAVMFTVTLGSSTACGSVSPSSGATTSGGVLTATYTASTTAGTCVVTAFEANGATSSSITITQNAVPNKVVVAANPASITAVTSSTSALTVTVTSGVGGAAVVGDTITLVGTVPDPSCGGITALSNGAKTDASGKLTATYTATATVGFCTITATDTTGGGSGTVRITQTNPASAALVTTVTATPASVPADGGASATTSAIVATVKTSGGTLVNGDHVQWTLTPSTAGACPATPGSTDTISGQITWTYTPTTTVGTCTITATEADSGSSGSATVTQTVVGNTVTFTTLVPTQAEGGGASAVVAHVQHLAANVASDLVTFTTGGGAACGVFNPTSATTPAGGGTNGNASTNYTPSLTVGFCKVTATDATGASVSATITQTTNPAALNTNTIAATAPAPNNQANGANTSTITATVAGANIAGDPIMFILTPAGAGQCGSISPTATTTNGTGVATATYTVSTTSGTCNITAKEANGGSTSTAPAAVTTVPRPNNITLTANPTAVSTSGAGTSTLTVTVTNANTGVGVNADGITFMLTASGAPGTCGSNSPVSGSTNSSGVFTTTYTTGAVIGSCSITATAASGETSSAVVITQTA